MNKYSRIDDVVNIERIDFGVMSNNEVKNYSAISESSGIVLPESYDNGEPKKGGLIDPRLGVTDKDLDCATCGLNSDSCPGHFGHTELEEPIFHIGFLTTIKNILGCICPKCSKLLIYKTDKELDKHFKAKTGRLRFAEVHSACQNIKYCQRPDGCGIPIPKIKTTTKKDQGSAILLIAETDLTELGEEKQHIEGKKKIKQILTADIVYNILKNISDSDFKIMGFDPTKMRPENLIYKIFPIPPVAIRPSVRTDFMTSSTYEDGLTKKLSDILRTNRTIKKNKEKEITGNENKYSVDSVNLLQYHIATYFDNESLALPKAAQKVGGQPIKSLSDRLKGKTGRIRGNLLGKRVDFSSRTVITSDPNISIDELGVPIRIAMNLTFPEIVTPYNIEELTKLVQNGKNKYPGANYVIQVSPQKNGKNYIDLRYRSKIKLRFGDIVERHLKDGDPVLFNRQPTLHKLSMMSHKIRVINNWNYNTFRLNVSATTPYNADYDGVFANF